jgi:hypothetical protein
MSKREPNWDEIGKISQHAEALKAAGKMDYSAWRALFAEAEVACNGFWDYTEFMFQFAGPGWIKRLSSPNPNRSAPVNPGAQRSPQIK